MVPPGDRAFSGSDEGFQKLLLRIAANSTEKSDSNKLIQLFCRATRGFFDVSGVYFWRCQPGDELVGEQADGKMAERFAGIRLRPFESTVTAEAVRQRRTIFANHVNAAAFPAAREFEARSLLAAPLVVFNEVVGAVTFLHDSNDEFFSEDFATKATILAGQLGSLLEAARLGKASRKKHRRAEILADVAQALHGSPDVGAVIEALADRLRLLLRTRLVCVLLRREGPFELKAVSAETPQLATSARARHDRQTLRFAADLAQRAVAAGEPLTLSIGADVHSLGNLVSPGMLLAAPFRTARTQGAILIYPRQDGIFSSEERALVGAIAGFGAVAVAHAELHATAHSQAEELHQLLEVSLELGASGDLDRFLHAFVMRASGFLGFGRCFIALLENDQFQVRYGVEQEQPKRLEHIFPKDMATTTLRAKEVFWTDDASRVPGVNMDAVSKYKVHQFLAVLLLGASGTLLGMFGLLDRVDGTGISQEDIRRARALSNQVAVTLEAARNLHLSEQHRRRAEALIELAREIDGSLRLPEFSYRFVRRAAELTGCRGGLLCLRQEDRWNVVALYQQQLSLGESAAGSGRSPDALVSHDTARAEESLVKKESQILAASQPLDRDSERDLGSALAEYLARHGEKVISAPAQEMLSMQGADTLRWSECTLIHLSGTNGE